MHHCFKESGKHTPWVVLIQLKCDDGQMHTYKSVKQLSRQHLPFFRLVSAPISFTSYWYEWNIIYPKTFKNIIFTSTSFKLKKSGFLSCVAWSVGGSGLALSPEPIPGLWTGFLESIHSIDILVYIDTLLSLDTEREGLGPASSWYAKPC